jgi:hypothetical protein
MKKLIGSLFGILMFAVVAFSQIPGDGAMLFSSGCATYKYPIVFVYENGGVRTSDFQANVKKVVSWGFAPKYIYVKTATDSFNCVILPTSYSGMGWVNKKDSRSDFNGIYYNAKRDSVFMIDYPNREAIDFLSSNMLGGITYPATFIHYETDQQIWYDHFRFGNKILCFNRMTHDPFGNVIEIIDSMNQVTDADDQWVCADKRIVADSLDSLNWGVNFYDFNGIKGFLVTSSADQNHYEFISVYGKRFQVPWLSQDSANLYSKAVMFSWGWQIYHAKPVSPDYLFRYALAGNIPVSYKTSDVILKNKNFPNTKWEVTGMWGLKAISDSEAKAEYGVNWSAKLVEIPDAFLANYTIAGISTRVVPRPAMKAPSFKINFAQNVIYDVMGRKIFNTQRAGLNLVQTSQGVKTYMNINRQHR